MSLEEALEYVKDDELTKWARANRERGHVRSLGHPLASLYYVAFRGGATGMRLGLW